jgi:hypothetical protein
MPTATATAAIATIRRSVRRVPPGSRNRLVHVVAEDERHRSVHVVLATRKSETGPLLGHALDWLVVWFGLFSYSKMTFVATIEKENGLTPTPTRRNSSPHDLLHTWLVIICTLAGSASCIRAMAGEPPAW